MKKIIYSMFCTLMVLSPVFAVEKSIDFDQISGESYYNSPIDIVEEGETFVFTITGGDPAYGFYSIAAYPGELLLGDSGGNTVQVTLTHKDNKYFDLVSMDLMYSLGTANWTISGYKDGSPVSGSPKSVVLGSSSYTNTAIGFLQVDEVTIEENPVYAGGFTMWADKFVVDNINDGSLPVELLSFTASSNKTAVDLNWATASETDNLGFIIERSTKDSGWQEIASYKTHNELTGQGTTSSSTQYSYSDSKVNTGDSYSYRLLEVCIDGTATVIGSAFVAIAAIPDNTQLLAAYPNPFNPSTNLQYQLANDSFVSMSVFDLMGRQVKTLVNQQQTAGEYSVSWNGQSDNGLSVPSGTYLVRMQTGNIKTTRKILLLK